MNTNIVFLGGLPRSGSTLLNNLLGQHKDISISGTSGLTAIIQQMRQVYTNREEFGTNDPIDMKSRFKASLVGAMSGWSLSDTTIFLDKGRGWLPMVTLLKELYGPLFKMIVPVRDLRGVFASMEKLYRNNILNIDPVISSSPTDGLTIQDRVDTWASGLPVGTCVGNVKDLIDKGLTDGIFFVRMEDLTSNPQGVLDQIYSYLEIESKTIEFPIVNKSKENDKLYGIEGLHDTVESEIFPCSTDYENILGKGISDQIFKGYSWFYRSLYTDLVNKEGQNNEN